MRSLSRHVFVLLILAVITPITAAQITYNNFGSTAGLVLNGSASQVGGNLQLTPAAGNQAGTAWHQTQQPVIGGFVTSFAFRIGGPGGADGMTFIIHDDPAGTGALCQGGGSLAYTSEPLVVTNTMQNLLVIEIDTYNNANFADPNDNHISVHLIPTIPTTVNGADEFYSIGRAIPTTDLNDGQVHVMCVTYTPGTLTIFLDDLATPLLTVPFDFISGATTLTGTTLAGLNLPTGNAYVGFTGGTGGLVQTHEVFAWNFGSAACGLSGSWQVNSPESSVDIDGAQVTNSFAGPANTNLLNGNNGIVTIASSLVGNGFEVLLNVAPAVPGSSFPGFFTPVGGQAVNVNLAGAIYLNGGNTFAFPPHPGIFSAPISLPNGVVISGQQIVLNPAAADGFTLSQAAQGTGVFLNCPNSPTATNTFAGDDTSYLHTFTSGSFTFYGLSYADCWVNSNGNITFNGGDTGFVESEAAFLQSWPRVAPAWNDFSPNAGGQVNVEEVNGVFMATWFAVPEFGLAGSINTFCASLDLTTGIIGCSYDFMSTSGNPNALVGISPGGGLGIANNVDLSTGPNLGTTASSPVYEDFTQAAYGPFDLALTTHTYFPTGIGTGPYTQF